ncbi:class I SAM-dependent methyltransferase [Gluconobacter wancherniae]|uniref:class I SAM-dependent methyltransferase n=1 Tax=Gluconobacter wancherniae TaxID=1307955 RepID=UPI001B8ABDEC|nr:class I SAM-dependent methyltransferase [Gluconobacter wancherniae]MBS1093661.1 methyltransferase domain-containing protein [Gluconobacter wancherniae]
MSSSESTSAVFDAFRRLDDDAWLAVLVASVQQREIDGVEMPGFPSVPLQRELHGHDGEVSIHEAHVFYREIKAYCAYAGSPITSATALMDFGCGWGRMARLFMKDIPPSQLFGVETTSRFLMAARRANPCLAFLESELTPPLPMQAEALDTVVSWSVFSHFDEFLAGHWVREFHRLLRPGGMFVFTTQSRRFIAFCAEQRLRRASGMRLEHPWHEACADSFLDEALEFSRYEKGLFLYASSAKPPHPQAHYGEAIIPRNYIIKVWGHLFRLVEYMDNPARLPQVLVVLQKI